MIVAAHLAPLSTVIPTQVGTHASVGAHYEGDELLRPAASAVFFAGRAPVATYLGPRLRGDDDGHMTVRETTSTRNARVCGPTEVKR